MGQGKVLVVGDDTRGFLATVRALGRKRITIDVAPKNFQSAALLSRYIRRIHKLPSWSGDGEDWLSAMEGLLIKENYDLVIPCDERTLLPLQRHRMRLSQFAQLAIPDDPVIATLFDKHATRVTARQAGVAVPSGRLLRVDDTASALLREFGTPLVVKPRWSYTLDKLEIRSRVYVVWDEATLVQILATLEPDKTLLETHFPGQGVGMSVLASKGHILQIFEHHRVRERSGASFYRVSATPTPALVAACGAMLHATQHTGIAMFEFKVNEASSWALLEVNARPWGSLPLPVSLGVDFPNRWYCLLVHGEETPAVSYRAGVFGRNLLPDFQASLADMQDLGLGPARSVCFMAGRVLELLRCLGGREVHDVLVRDDPRPGIEELWRSIKKATQYLGRVFTIRSG